VDAAGSPISNAIVMVDGEKTNSVTKPDGTYKVRVSPNALRIGIFTFGQGVFEEDISGRDKVDFNFASLTTPDPVETAPGQTGEIVNTGYTNVKDKNLTTNIKKVDVKKSKRTYTSIYEMLQGVSGVMVSPETKTINIQASRNFLGAVPPLILVDGVPVEMGSLDNIPPGSVANIEVLKNTAAAMYGSRGYGGVILITTKKTLEE
jgi:TonB-dependent SusC/RagA subfamily outer membrane receptor